MSQTSNNNIQQRHPSPVEMNVILDSVRADGHDGLRTLLTELCLSSRRINGGIFVQFTGLEDPAMDKKSWCPDCVKAEPVIKQALDELYNMKRPELLEDQHLIIVYIVCNVGGREKWKSSTNAIKADVMLDVQAIPTLIEYSRFDGSPVQGRKLDKVEQFTRVTDIVDFILKRHETTLFKKNDDK